MQSYSSCKLGLFSMFSCSMADVLTLGQQQIFSSALSGPTKISSISQQQLSEYNNSILDSALKKAKKDVHTLSLLNQSSMSVPLPLVTPFKAGVHLILGSFSWVEFTQLLRAGLGSTVELNLQCSHPLETKPQYTQQSKKCSQLSTNKSYLVDKFSSCVCG